MVKAHYVKAGRLVRIIRGPRADKVGVIVDIIDANRVLVENTKELKMWRHVQNVKNIQPLKFSVHMARNSPSKVLDATLDKSKVLDKYAQTCSARAIAGKQALAQSTDFERYQLRVAKRSRAHWARKLMAENEKKSPVSYAGCMLKKLEKPHKKFADKHLAVRHDRIKKFFVARKAKKIVKKL